MSTGSAAAATALVAAFRSGDGVGASGAWELDRDAIADRLEELVVDPTRIRQGRLNLCGPAAVMSIWFTRDPAGAVQYATELFDRGQVTMGDLTVIASAGLRRLPYRLVESARGCPQADWMMMAALRDSTNRLLRYQRPAGPREAAAAITLPSAMRTWLIATGVVSAVRDETNLVWRKGLAHAATLSPAPDRELLLLVAQEMFGRPPSWHRRIRDRVVSLVPNHWVVLRSPVEAVEESVRFTFWSWGALRQATLPRVLFDRCYYGCLAAQVVSDG
jgi:hypothetical protein